MKDLFVEKIEYDDIKDLIPYQGKLLYNGKFENYLGIYKNISKVPMVRGIYVLIYNMSSEKNGYSLITYKVCFRGNSKKIEKKKIEDKKIEFIPYKILENDNKLMRLIKNTLNDLKISEKELADLFNKNLYKSSDIHNIKRKLHEGGDLSYNKFMEIIELLPDIEVDINIKRV